MMMKSFIFELYNKILLYYVSRSFISNYNIINIDTNDPKMSRDDNGKKPLNRL